MIRSFRHKGLERLYGSGDRKGIAPELVDKVLRVLARLDAASSPAALDLPGYRLHKLKGDLRGSWSVWVSGNWRVVFRFDGTDVVQVALLDYH